MASSADIRELESWLTTPAKSIPPFDHEDGEWVIAGNFRTGDLLILLDRPDCVPSRRDSIIYALVLQLTALLDPHEVSEPHAPDEASTSNDTLLSWARSNWADILRVDQEMGLGADFDTFVVPFLPPEFQQEREHFFEAARATERRHRLRSIAAWTAKITVMSIAGFILLLAIAGALSTLTYWLRGVF